MKYPESVLILLGDTIFEVAKITVIYFEGPICELSKNHSWQNSETRFFEIVKNQPSHIMKAPFEKYPKSLLTMVRDTMFEITKITLRIF